MTDIIPQGHAITCPAATGDGVRCTVEGRGHQFHYGPDAGGGVRRMWADAGQAADAPVDARLHTLGGHIAALVAQGYEVTFTVGFGADPVGAHVEKPGDPDAGCTALGYTAAAALWAASPLHSDDEPMPGAGCACGHVRDSHWEIAAPGGARAGCAVLRCPCRMYGEYEPGRG